MATAVVDSVVTNNALDWDAMSKQIDEINRLAMDDLVMFYRNAAGMGYERGRVYLTEALFNLIADYDGMSSGVTALWWDEIMDQADYAAQVASMPKSDYIAAQVRWGTALSLTSDEVLSRLGMLVQKHVFGAHRDTVALNAENTKVSFARLARADACAFCRVVASRGAVYGSRRQALYVGAGGRRVRGARAAGQKYHDHCRCIVAPNNPSRDLNLPDYYERFSDEYDEAVEILGRLEKGKPLTIQAVTRIMRANGNGK